MTKALILYTNGKYEEKSLKDYKEYQKIVGGNIEMLPVMRGYVNPSQHYPGAERPRLLCYVNDEGMIKQLPSNPWCGLLSVLGVSVYSGMPIFGNVIVFSEGEDGDEGVVDPYIVSLVKKYKECEDDDAFFVALEKLNTPDIKRKKQCVVTKETPHDEGKKKKKKKARSDECWCEDKTKEETKTCVVITCSRSVTRLLEESERKLMCPYHNPIKPVLFCGQCKYVCDECIDIGWVSLDGTGGGSGLFNRELGLKIKKGKLVTL